MYCINLKICHNAVHYQAAKHSVQCPHLDLLDKPNNREAHPDGTRVFHAGSNMRCIDGSERGFVHDGRVRYILLACTQG